MKERLIELLKEHCVLRQDVLDCTNRKTDDCPECLADYLIANGVIVPPCKVGQTVYVICNHEVQETTVFSMSMETEDNKYVFYIKAKAFDGTNKTVDGYYVAVFKKFIFGKTVFLTKEEAEQKLKERKEDEGK